ncbi:hypothetical protein QO179_23680 [Bacillus stercoris]|nr:hypothetical protein [Bacillus stercoris]
MNEKKLSDFFGRKVKIAPDSMYYGQSKDVGVIKSVHNYHKHFQIKDIENFNEVYFHVYFSGGYDNYYRHDDLIFIESMTNKLASSFLQKRR